MGSYARPHTPGPVSWSLSYRLRRSPIGGEVIARALRFAYSPEAAAVLVDGLRTSDLERAWEASSVALREARTVRHRTALVNLRGALLDELDRPHRRGVRDWRLRHC